MRRGISADRAQDGTELLVLRVGIRHTVETLDQVIKALQVSDLFADYSISGNARGNIALRIHENSIISCVIRERNMALNEIDLTRSVIAGAI